ncbi:hypothetical protein CEP53_012297 [Fusarium sp. AF-6]|nr:hypothetical protein CEP53_012297 [Fusarium sp. AF-6]
MSSHCRYKPLTAVTVLSHSQRSSAQTRALLPPLAVSSPHLPSLARRLLLLSSAAPTPTHLLHHHHCLLLLPPPPPPPSASSLGRLPT